MYVANIKVSLLIKNDFIPDEKEEEQSYIARQ